MTSSLVWAVLADVAIGLAIWWTVRLVKNRPCARCGRRGYGRSPGAKHSCWPAVPA